MTNLVAVNNPKPKKPVLTPMGAAPGQMFTYDDNNHPGNVYMKMTNGRIVLLRTGAEFAAGMSPVEEVFSVTVSVDKA